MATITDQTLDRLSAELRAMAEQVEAEQTDSINEANLHAARELSGMLREIAIDRPTLALFADLLSRHGTKAAALSELVSA